MTNFMKAKSNYLDSVKEVLEIEASAIKELGNHLGDEMNQAIELILKCSHRVIITGMGKSGIVGKKIAATLASTGTPSLFLHPAEGLHGDLGMVTEDDIVIAISNSGETEEILKTLPSIKRIGAKIITLVGNDQSTLAEKSNITISIGKVKEACPLGLAPTTSTTLTLALGDALAIALLKARGFTPQNFALFHPGGSLGRQLLLTVEDIIQETKKNPVAYIDDNIKDVLFIITASGLGAISIVDQSGHLTGILTDGDIRRALTAGSNIFDKLVKEFHTKNPLYAKTSMLAAEALKLMEDNKINVLPVVNENRQVIAMIHMHDLTKMGI
ncbi:KpsF/GutQ family sugar-phosphate isomerase [Domibacillus epiphyticus]|uniref:Arabinose-5-phosphate isomerase n=1 Tax=Domibacillus epiphyticus TaxID=1714355 RepID=A0A1V2A550_9BACI|nr:KpsF/GutQ family sugar-phosphate isomerase [Domibacillus epiphyticus]OMP66113.1 hypothetical protein BTO28_14000 [Domibacillus epiphyticus]